jgi:hypothetical protein
MLHEPVLQEDLLPVEDRPLVEEGVPGRVRDSARDRGAFE